MHGRDLPTGTEAARRTGTGVRRAQRLLSGRQDFPVHELVKLARAYDLGPETFLQWAWELEQRRAARMNGGA
jgi:plasmid maintenance system antidote protein VapI